MLKSIIPGAFSSLQAGQARRPKQPESSKIKVDCPEQQVSQEAGFNLVLTGTAEGRAGKKTQGNFGGEL